MELNFDLASILNVKEILIDRLPKKRINYTNKKLSNSIKKIMKNEFDLANEILSKQGVESTIEQYVNDFNDKIMFYDDIDKIVLILSEYIIMKYIENMKLVEAFYNDIEL